MTRSTVAERSDAPAPDRTSGTAGYADAAASLIKQYESVTFEAVHRSVLHLIPAVPGRILDLGSGTGRDAAAFAARGHRVTAVEPTAALRLAAESLHPSASIEWLDDSLPALASLADRRESFDVVMLTAVWMHLDEGQRRRAMPVVADLVQPGGVVILSLRHGPVPPGRRMFDVTADETTRAARAAGLTPALQRDGDDGLFGRPGVTWTRLAYAKPA